MKKILAMVMLVILASASIYSLASENRYGDPTPIEITAYHQGTITASGKAVRTGYIAGKKEWVGKTAVLYDADMRYIGIFEIEDTGGDPRIRNGNVVDVYMDSTDECFQFGRQEGYIQIIDAKG